MTAATENWDNVTLLRIQRFHASCAFTTSKGARLEDRRQRDTHRLYTLIKQFHVSPLLLRILRAPFWAAAAPAQHFEASEGTMSDARGVWDTRKTPQAIVTRPATMRRIFVSSIVLKAHLGPYRRIIRRS